MAQKKKNGLRWGWRILGSLLSVFLFAFLYLTLIVGQQQPSGASDPAPQPRLTPGPALNVSTEAELFSLISSFPVPVMSFMSGSGIVFVSGTSADTAWQDGVSRVATLYWQTAEGQPLILQSICPAAALDLLAGGDYAFSGTAGPTLFGQSSVRMENADTVRLHTVTDTGVYALTVPRALAGSVSVLSRSIQLFTVEETGTAP